MTRSERTNHPNWRGIIAVAVFTVLAVMGGTANWASADFSAAQCRSCHQDPDRVPVPYIPDTHHLLVGQSCAGSNLVNGSDRPNQTCDQTYGYYDCLSCHKIGWNGQSWALVPIPTCINCHLLATIQSATLSGGTITLTGSGFIEGIKSNTVYVDMADDPLGDCPTTVLEWTDQSIVAESGVLTDGTQCAKLSDTVVVPCAITEAMLQDPSTHIPAPAAPSIYVIEGYSGRTQVSPNDPTPGDIHTYMITTAPAHGTAQVTATGRVTYTPDSGYVGPDSMTVTVTDQAGNSGSTEIRVTVIPETQRPEASAGPASGIYHEQVTVTLSATDNADPSPVIHYTVDGSMPTLDSPIYASPLTVTRTTTIRFFAVDRRGNQGSLQMAVYTINYLPAPTAPGISITDGGSGTSQISANDPDPGDVHTYTILTAAAHGTAAVSTGGLVTYTPTPDFLGTDSVTVAVTDQNGGSGSLVITADVGTLSCTDADRDGYAPEGNACGPVDCDDTRSDINPGMTEICGNSYDENCDDRAEYCTTLDVAVSSVSVPRKVRNCSATPKKVRAEISNPGDLTAMVRARLTADGVLMDETPAPFPLDPGSVARVSFTLDPLSLAGPTAKVCVEAATVGGLDSIDGNNGKCAQVIVVECR